MINIEYENEPCSMIQFRNWTQNIKYQFSKAHGRMEEMIYSTISDSMEVPASSILKMLKNLSIMMESMPGA
jgi:ABC-type Fe2+-enterobactin transport system substrate-binding protein